MLTRAVALIVCSALPGCTSHHRAEEISRPISNAPLSIGDTFTLNSKALNEPRKINVFVPTLYGEAFKEPLPVLYMPDGGLDEDFLHVAGLVQVLVSNGGMRPHILVGIPNTVRRRDLSGPTENPEDRMMAPVVGGSAAYRAFIRTELMPEIRARYKTTGENAIVGESLAGLFVVETFFLEPGLFGTYIAIDPSLWWNSEELSRKAGERLKAVPQLPRTLFIASGSDSGLEEPMARIKAAFDANPVGLQFHYLPMPAEKHATIYHPAALIAFRTVFALPPAAKKE